MMSSLKWNYFYNIIYRLVNALVPLFLTPYVSRVLGAEGIGRYAYTFTIAGYFAMFVLLGVNSYGNRAIAYVRNDQNKLSQTFWSIYLWQFIMCLAMMLIYGVYVWIIADDYVLAALLSLYILSAGLDINWLYSGIENFKKISYRNIIVRIITAFSIFLFVKSANDVVIYTAIYAISTIVSSLILWTGLKKILLRPHIEFHEVYKHIYPNVMLFLPSIAVSLQSFINKVILGWLSNKSEVGYFYFSEQFLMVPTMLIDSLGIIMLPRMSYLASQHDDKTSMSYFYRSICLAVFTSSLSSFLIMSIAREFVPFFFGNDFLACVLLFQIVLLRCVPLALANVIRTQYLLPRHLEAYSIKAVYLGVAVNVSVSVILIPYYQSIGAAIGGLLGDLIICLYQFYILKKYINIRRILNYIWPFIVSGIFMWSVNWSIVLSMQNDILVICIKLLLGIMVYGISVLLVYGLYKPALLKNVLSCLLKYVIALR